MKFLKTILFFFMIFLCTGCQPEKQKIHLREEIKSDTLASNIVTRPVVQAFSALIGEGIEIDSAVLRRNKADLLELHISGFNRSYSIKKFRYRVEWFDKDGLLISTKTSVWLPMSAMGKSPFNFKAAATTPEAVDFKMDTRKWE